MREWRLGYALRRGARKRADAVADADESVAGEVDAKDDTQEGVGEGFVGEGHCYEYGAGAEMVAGAMEGR